MGSDARLLLDSDIFIDHLRGKLDIATVSGEIAYSTVTRCELFADKDNERQIATLLAPFEEIVVDREIAEAAGRIRRSLGIKTPDALIAASALKEGRVLLTRNTKHFRQISSLALSEPS